MLHANYNIKTHLHPSLVCENNPATNNAADIPNAIRSTKTDTARARCDAGAVSATYTGTVVDINPNYYYDLMLIQ